MTESEDIIFKKFKDEQVVEFNVVNNTSSNITLDLFNLATLSNVDTSPTIQYPSYTLINSITNPVTQLRGGAFNSNNNLIYYTSQLFTNTDIFSYDIDGNFLGIISVGSPTRNAIYNSSNNKLYLSATTNTIIVLDCNTNLVSSVIALSGVNSTGSMALNTTSNELNVIIGGFGGSVDVIDCNTDTNILTIITSAGSREICYVPYQDRMYLASQTTGINYIDCATQTYFALGVPILGTPRQMSFSPVSNKLYIPLGIPVVHTLDTNTLLLLPDINLVFTIRGSVYNSNDNLVYIYPFNEALGRDLIVVDCATNNIINTIPLPFPFLQNISVRGGLFIPVNDKLLLSSENQDIALYNTQPILSPFYITGTGASNYNFFLQNLENEPIKVYYVRVISSQTQLSNVAQITEIDANGNEKQLPHFPILGVSAFQEQGNIGFIDFKGKLILDGRTYLSNYIINANESVIFEIHYTQLNRDAIKSIFSKILPKKTPLKGFFDEYVEM